VIDPRAPAFAIEHRADAAWPAEEQQALGPWKLRATRGVTHRANSVLTAGHDPAGGFTTPVFGVDALLAQAEAFYTERKQPIIFRMSAVSVPGYLDSLLHRRGYVVEKPTEAMTAESRTVLERAGPATPTAGELVTAPGPDGGWLDCAFAGASPEARAVQAAIVTRIAPESLFAAIHLDGHAAACGLAVSDGGWTGCYAIATRPAHRGRGLATAVVRRLAAWALERGDARIYLLVQSDNDVAKRLYQRCGFTTAYVHHYRVKPT
jgi:GNAT superfamily N-acetyltransferase